MRRSAILLTAIFLLLAGVLFVNLRGLVAIGYAQQPSPTPEADFGNLLGYTEQDVRIGTAYAKTRGHLLAAFALSQAGDLSAANVQIDRAKAQLTLLENNNNGKTAAAPLRAALDAFATAVQQRHDSAKVTTAYQNVISALDTAQRAALGELIDDMVFKGSVVESLLKAVVQKYSTAFKDGKLVQQADYQDAVAYVRVAGELWTDIVGSLDVDSPEAYLDIEVRFASLNIICPDYIKPPQKPINAAEVEGIVTTLNNALGDLLLLPLFE